MNEKINRLWQSTWRVSLPVTSRGKATLISAAIAVVAVPFAIGVLQAQAAGSVGQGDRAQTRSFEITSIKPSNSGGTPGEGARRVGTEAGGRFVMVDGATMVLIRSAFSDAVEVIAAPDWTRSEHYDVEARAKGPSAEAEIAEMLRSLLAERFKLTAHYEMREKPTYSLMLERSDGKLGPSLKRYDSDCNAYEKAASEGREKPKMTIPSNGVGPCSYRISPSGIAAGGIDMATLARAAKFYTEQPVFDKTGLSGYYEFKFEVTRDVTIFTALREQLGLKLESARMQLPVLIIDKIERPTEN